MLLIRNIILILLAFASIAVSDRYVCRFRVTNVSPDLADQVRSPDFVPLLEVPGTQNSSKRISADVGEDVKVAEVLFEVEKSSGSQFSALSYKNLGKGVGLGIPPGQITLRCSKVSSESSSQFTESYALKLASPVAVAGDRTRQLVTLERQNALDCYLNGGFEHPYSLERFDRYLTDGERFETGCSMVGTCRNGGLSAVSACPPFIFPPTIAEVRKVGQCCDHGIGKETVEAKGCQKNENGIAFTFPTTQLPRYRPVYIPWQVRFGQKNSDLVCDGVIINENWFLTTKSCLNDKSNIKFLRPHSVRTQPPKPQNVAIVEVKKIVDNDHNLDLVLAKLNFPFVTGDWTTAVQKVNLPWSRAVCEKFLAATCPILLGTEERNVNVDPNVIIAETSGQSGSNQSYIKSIRKRESWPALLGSGVVSWQEKVNFLVGIYVGNAEKKVVGDKISLKGAWKDDGVVGNMISVCPFLDAISQIIGE